MRSALRDFALSTTLSVEVTLRTSQTRSIDAGLATYAEATQSLSAFRQIVTEDSGEIRKGDVGFFFNPAQLDPEPRPKDRIEDSDGTIWTIYMIERDPLSSLLRCWTRRRI